MFFNNFNKKRKSTYTAGEGEAQNISEEQQKILSEEKKDMIQGIEDLSETVVKEVMIPRIDVDFISIDTTKEELLKKIKESGHSRFPVYEESIDNVIGVLYVKDLVYAISESKVDGQFKWFSNMAEPPYLEKIIRSAYFVPESKRIDILLREFKRKHLHIAIAIDEYGGIAGLITMEDIIEEIVGDIQDEFDNEREDIISVGKDVYICDARCDLDDLNEALNASFPASEFDSLGGFVFDLFGKIPVRFEKVHWQDYDFIVQDMAGHRINLIKIIKKIEDKGEDNEKKE